MAKSSAAIQVYQCPTKRWVAAVNRFSKIPMSFIDRTLPIGTAAGIAPPVSPRALFAMLIAVAMLFAPLAARNGAAMAMAPADHHGQMADKEHCGDEPATSDDSKAVDKSCCAAMCVAVAVAPSAPIEPHLYVRSVERPAQEQYGRSFLAELPTPPPRRA